MLRLERGIERFLREKEKNEFSQFKYIQSVHNFVMTMFYIVMLVLLIIAIINLVRALKKSKSNSKLLGVTINIIAIVLLLTALVIGWLLM